MFEANHDFTDDMDAEGDTLEEESHIHHVEVTYKPDDGVEKLVFDPLRKNHLICIPF